MVAQLPTDRQINPLSEITLQLFESIGRGEPDQWLFHSSSRKGALTRQAVADRMKRWSVEFDVHLHPHRTRHSRTTHVLRRGCNLYTLSQTLGHSSSDITGHYLQANPDDSSSLTLG